MEKRTFGKKSTVLTYIIAYSALLYICFFLQYLNYTGLIPYEYPVRVILKNACYVFLGLFSVKYFFETVFFNARLLHLEFLPVRFKELLRRIRIKYDFGVMGILSVLFLTEASVWKNWGTATRTYIFSGVICIALTRIVLCGVLFVLSKRKVRRTELVLAERILYVSGIFLYPLVLKHTCESIVFCSVGILVIAASELFFGGMKDRIYQIGLYRCLYAEKTQVKVFGSRVRDMADCIWNKLGLYCMLEVKRYSAIGKVNLSFLIQYGITATVLLLFCGKEGNGHWLFVVLSVLSANNFYATTAYSSDMYVSYEFYPLCKIRHFVTKVISASIFQTGLFVLTYGFVLVFFKDEMVRNMFVFLILLVFLWIYSVCGCLLDFVFRKKTEQMNELLYGNFPKVLLVVGAFVISGVLITVCGNYL